MLRYILFSFSIAICSLSESQDINDFLFPIPSHLEIKDGQLNRKAGSISIKSHDKRISKSILKVQGQLAHNGIYSQYSPSFDYSFQPLVKMEIDQCLKPQSYSLKINRSHIQIKGGDQAALNYALLTLAQIGQYANAVGHWPCLTIEDEPDFIRRGIMLDISRDKVPTMQTLFMLVDQFASWKLNEIQLYTEHTFAYKNHSTVWKDASPMTAEQIQALDQYCQMHFIDLVPNQNSFGHMKRWLIHEEYEHLAELPQPGKTIWGMMSRTSLSPVEPGSLELMKELYAELLPNFSSSYFNIGCDETVELGVGKSKDLCRQIGKGRVYLDYLLELKKDVDTYGRTTQFWGDIILHHPELIPELPKDMVALIWGYDAKHKFDKECAQFAASGLPFYVCPGTSTWNSILGRNENAFANLQNAAINGKKHGAMGYLNTNWGDQGHWQPLSVSYPSFVYGAALSWSVSNHTDINIDDICSRHVYNDDTNLSGKAIVNLGNAYLEMGVLTDNSNVFHQLLKRSQKPLKGDRWLNSVNEADTRRTISYIEEQLSQLQKANIRSNDKEIVLKEMEQACQLAIHSCHLALLKLNYADTKLNGISKEDRQKLTVELSQVIENHKSIWLLRNRPGGLSDSTDKMKKVLKTYN